MRIARQIILVIVFGWIKILPILDPRCQTLAEYLGSVELPNISLGHLVLPGVAGKNRGTVLAAGIGPLAVLLGRVVRDRKENLQQLAIADLGRIVGDLHCLGMPGAARTDLLVMRSRRLAAGVTGDNIADPRHMLEHPLHAPKTAASQYRRSALCGAGGQIHRWRGHGHRGSRGFRRHGALLPACCQLSKPRATATAAANLNGHAWDIGVPVRLVICFSLKRVTR